MERALVQTLKETHSLPDEGLRELLESEDASLQGIFDELKQIGYGPSPGRGDYNQD